jgi:hypothetical protein
MQMSLTRKPASDTPRTRRVSAAAPNSRNLEEQIQEYAYRIYLSRVREGVPGDPVTDWLRAEKELRTRLR